MEFILEYTRDHAPGREQITLRPVQSQHWEGCQEEEAGKVGDGDDDGGDGDGDDGEGYVVVKLNVLL